MARVPFTRRSVGGLCLALASVVTVVLAGPASANQHHEGLVPEGDWTDEQIEFMLALIEETEEVLPQRFPVEATYQELEEELGAMGFYEFGVPAPGGYDHWINPGWFFDEHYVNPEFSESLVYQEQGDGTYRLVSAMFMLAPDETLDDIPDHLAALPGWHGHPELCVNPDGTFAGVTDPDDPNCPPGTSQATTPLMMHVWIVDNECNHRFAGIGVQGLHCEHDMHMHEGDMDMDDQHDGTSPAEPVLDEPSFTG